MIGRVSLAAVSTPCQNVAVGFYNENDRRHDPSFPLLVGDHCVEMCSEHVFKVHMYLGSCHGVRETGRGLSHEGFEEVSWLEACDKSHEFGLICGLGHCDGFAVEACYITA